MERLIFADRSEAGKKLAEKLASYQGKHAIVLALPRGGVVTGLEVAKALSLPLDIVAVRKIGHPSSSEYAIGAIDEHGVRLLNEAEAPTVDRKWLAEETERQRAEALRRSVVYRGGRPPQHIAGKTAIIVDDGIATGLTLRLAVRSVKAQKPERIVVAVPVAPREPLAALTKDGADEIVLLQPPEDFLGAVGAHYLRFEQVEDAEVINALRDSYEGSGVHGIIS